MFLPGRSEHRLRPTTLECSSSHREQTRLFSTFVTRPFSFYHTPIIAKSRFWNLEQIAFPNRATISLPSQKFLRSFPFFPPFFLSLFLCFFRFFPSFFHQLRINATARTLIRFSKNGSRSLYFLLRERNYLERVLPPR